MAKPCLAQVHTAMTSILIEQVFNGFRTATKYLLLVTVFSVVILLFLIVLIIPVILRIAAGIAAGIAAAVVGSEAAAERRLLRRAQQLRWQRRQQVAGARGLLAAVCACTANTLQSLLPRIGHEVQGVLSHLLSATAMIEA